MDSWLGNEDITMAFSAADYQFTLNESCIFHFVALFNARRVVGTVFVVST